MYFVSFHNYLSCLRFMDLYIITSCMFICLYAYTHVFYMLHIYDDVYLGYRQYQTQTEVVAINGVPTK